MDEASLFTIMAVLIVLASFSAIILSKLKLPSIIGFLLTGIIIVNFMGASEETESVIDIFSDLGLVMLLFTIGLEIDITKLRTQGKFAIAIAIIQIPAMLFAGMTLGAYLGYTSVQAVTLGAVLSGASTAVVISVLKTNNVLDQGKMDILVLVMIIEDICQVIMISLLTPMMRGESMSPDSMLVLFIDIAVFMVACSTLGLKIIPRVIDWFYDHSNDELISLLCIGLLFVFAMLAKMIGLSVAIGAFLVGLMVSLSKPREVVQRFVDPMKILFIGIFFISVGTKVSLTSLVDNLAMVVVFYLVFICCMFLAVNTGYWVAGGDSRSGWISALSMCTMGEFAFIISKQAFDYEVFDQGIYSSIIGAAILSMFLLPILVRTSEKTFAAADRICPGPLKKLLASMSKDRDLVYHGLSVASYRTTERFSKALTNVSFLIVLIVFIEIVFFFAYDPLSVWFSNNFGSDQMQWRIIILAANIFILLEPCRRVAKFFKFVVYLKERGEANLGAIEGGSPLAYGYVSTLALGAALDVAIVIIVPNNVENLVHILVLLAVLFLVLLYQFFKYRSKTRAVTTDIPEDAEEE